MRHMSHLMCHVSCVICHMSHVRCQVSCVKCHLFFWKNLKFTQNIWKNKNTKNKKIYKIVNYKKKSLDEIIKCIKLDKVMELVGGESLINWATPSRPGVAGAVLQTPWSLSDSLMDSLSHPFPPNLQAS